MARIHVILDDDVLDAIDKKVGPRGRSDWLERAARDALRFDELSQALNETAGILSAEDHPHWKDRAAVRAWVSEVRGRGRPRGPKSHR